MFVTHVPGNLDAPLWVAFGSITTGSNATTANHYVLGTNARGDVIMATWSTVAGFCTLCTVILEVSKCSSFRPVMPVNSSQSS
jgi:hypothetical protein